MKNIFVLIVINMLCIQYLQGQTILVRDSIDESLISYAEFQIDGQTFYADSLGQFNLTKEYKNLTVYKPGYYRKTIKKIPTTIKLSPKTYSIQTVEIKKRIIKTIDSRIKSNKTTILPFGLQIGYKYNNPYNEEGILKNLTLPIKQIFKNNNAIISIRFYKIVNNKVEVEPIENGTIEISVDNLKKKKNTINLAKNIIILPKDGVLISLTVIEENGTDFFKESKPSIRFYNSKDIGKTYILDVDNHKWISDPTEYNIIGMSIEAAF